ncbi:MAG: DUF1501 domain-containing protein [Planctomycetes bacterium]|nr:DUF1501 domain-containing protein [Planctomycetota bacterium]
MSCHDLLHAADDLTRRMFLGETARRLFGLGAASFLLRDPALPGTDGFALGPASARNVVYVFLRGGLSHIDSFDPKPGAATAGPVQAIATSADGVQVSEYFPHLARQMDKVAILSGMSSTQGAHAQGQYLMRTGYELRGTIQHPSLGAWVNRMAGRINPTMPGHVILGGGADMPSAGFFPPQFLALPIGDPKAGLQHSARARGVDEATFQRRLDLLAKMNQGFQERFPHKQVTAYGDMYAAAVRLMRSDDLVAFDLGAEPAGIRNAYGDGTFGQGCLLARRLVEHGVRFVEVVSDGWDTHVQNFDALEEKTPDLDRGLACLLADLDARGLLRETLVVVATEFGRSPEITRDNNGRNHYPKAFSCLLAGGGIRGGVRYGQTDAEGKEVLAGRTTIPDLNATIAHALGLPLEHVVHSPAGRPFTVADKGKPVLALFG